MVHLGVLAVTGGIESMTRYRIYTGPSIVKAIADRLSAAGLNVVVTGTEHVYVETCHSMRYLLGQLGPTWKANDITAICQVTSCF